MCPAFAAHAVYSIQLPDRVLHLVDRPLLMGIVNVTPDSFAELTRTLDPEVAIDVALRMEEDGADIIDIGGESTRPGADPVSAEEETARILPVIRALARRLSLPISVDTYKAAVARAAIDAVASIVNDVSGLRHDPSLPGVVAESGAALVLMHSRGRPKRMHEQAVYQDLVAEVAA
jgi:dihydropteroate synthase